jgi:GH35 family endo-1,4-beta-xylanase
MWLDFCAEVGLRPRARNIYSHENNPATAHLRPDGTPKNKSELEKTLVKRVEQVCRVLKGRNAIIQAIDEILADHEGGMRRDPFFDALGEEYVDILFHATHEAAPDAK